MSKPDPVLRHVDRCPVHPGAVLREDVIPGTGIGKTALARALGLSRQHLHDIVTERKPVSPTVAVRLGRAFGTSPAHWARMQTAHDLWHAERAVTGVQALNVPEHESKS